MYPGKWVLHIWLPVQARKGRDRDTDIFYKFFIHGKTKGRRLAPETLSGWLITHWGAPVCLIDIAEEYLER